ncbi:MAG TPA: methyltransferase domain-containing protein [Pirellulales bacterium]|nr:methyltransferase domain-containing protein [Pirellulales bacterium]
MAARDYKQDSLRHFNKIAPRYDNHRYGKQTRKVHQEVLRMVNELQAAALLDVGCGNGGFLALLQSAPAPANSSPPQNRKLAGADLSPEMIKVARQRLGESVDLQVADSEHLPWESGTFDCLTCNFSFHHYPQPQAVLLEMRRVLKPGGHVLIADPWFPAPLQWLANLIVRFSHLGDVRMYSLNELRTLLAAAGLQVVRAEHHGTSSYVLARNVTASATVRI